MASLTSSLNLINKTMSGSFIPACNNWLLSNNMANQRLRNMLPRTTDNSREYTWRHHRPVITGDALILRKRASPYANINVYNVDNDVPKPGKQITEEMYNMKIEASTIMTTTEIMTSIIIMTFYMYVTICNTPTKITFDM